MIEIKVWFQGTGLHDGVRRSMYTEAGEDLGLCLWMATQGDRVAQKSLHNIVKRLFPERVCACQDSGKALIHFNNHPETTRDMIDKVIHAYHMEEE